MAPPSIPLQSPRRVLSLGLCALVLLVFGGCAGSSRLVSEPHALLASAAPTDSQPSLDGRVVRLPEPGEVTLVDFWATSCAPCLKMMPAVQALYQDKRAAGLAVIGVAADDNPGLVQEYLAKLGIGYPTLLDPEGTLRGAYQVTDLPQTVLIDKKGTVRLVRLGGDQADLEAVHEAVDVLLAEGR